MCAKQNWAGMDVGAAVLSYLLRCACVEVFVWVSALAAWVVRPSTRVVRGLGAGVWRRVVLSVF